MFLRATIFVLAILTSVGVWTAMRPVSAQQEPAETQQSPLASIVENFAGATADFVIAGGDGYGATECLASVGQCGRIVADAWCDSKGFAKAVSYRAAGKDEITASTGRATGETAFVITCAVK